VVADPKQMVEEIIAKGEENELNKFVSLARVVGRRTLINTRPRRCFSMNDGLWRDSAWSDTGLRSVL